MNVSLLLIKSLHCLNLVILTFANFAVFVRILISKQPVPPPSPAFTLKLITVTPCISIFLSQIGLNLLQLLQNSLVRALVKASKSCHVSLLLNLSAGWNVTNELITSYSLSLSLSLSLTYKVLTTTQPSYLHNLISLQPPLCTRTSSFVTHARPQASSSLKSQTVLSDMHHLISGTNFLFHYVSLVLINLLQLHPLHHLHCHRPSHLHSFIPS